MEGLLHTWGDWVAPGSAEPLTTPIKEGTGSGGNLQGQPQGQKKVKEGVRTQQVAAILDKCHEAEHGAPAEAI